MDPNEIELMGLNAAATRGAVQRGTVREIIDGGLVRVEVPASPPLRITCDVLRSGNEPTLTLAVGDQVLVLLPGSDDVPGCILGIVGPYVPPPPRRTPAQVVVEAREDLVLKCGESSLTMNAEGKILLKGQDIVTRAKRTHKIKAGSVHIN